MNNKVLYFPFISVPESTWFTRILLYWDQVGSIIPFEFSEEPEKMSEYTRNLLTEELLLPIFPAQYLWKVPNFEQAFLTYIERLETIEIEKRRNNLKNSITSRIHVEKMQRISDCLIDYGLASQVDYSWCDVEKNTASEFMSYLAAILGCLEEVQSTPVTDTIDNLEPFFISSQSNLKAEKRLSPIRKIVLNELLPVPENIVPVDKIRIFKTRYGKYLSSFRYMIELELAKIADMTDPVLHKYSLDTFIQQKKKDIEDITRLLSKNGFGKITISNLCAIISKFKDVPIVFGLIDAIKRAFNQKIKPLPDMACLYAAYVKRELAK